MPYVVSGYWVPGYAVDDEVVVTIGGGGKRPGSGKRLGRRKRPEQSKQPDDLDAKVRAWHEYEEWLHERQREAPPAPAPRRAKLMHVAPVAAPPVLLPALTDLTMEEALGILLALDGAEPVDAYADVELEDDQYTVLAFMLMH